MPTPRTRIFQPQFDQHHPSLITGYKEQPVAYHPSQKEKLSNYIATRNRTQWGVLYLLTVMVSLFIMLTALLIASMLSYSRTKQAVKQGVTEALRDHDAKASKP